MPTNWPLSSSRSLDIEHPQALDAEATPRPSLAPSTSRFLDPGQSDKPDNPPAAVATTIKRSGLGYIADKLAPLHLHHHQHSSSKNVSPGPSTTTFDGVGASAANSSSKLHTSPSKPSGRTYDSTFVSREMHRLAHLPSALAPSLSSTVPSSTTTLVPSASSVSNLSIASGSSMADPWGALHVHILPLFNAEPLRIPIEDLNVLVRRHIQTVVSSAPNKAVIALETDASNLIGNGMVTLHAKLIDLKDEKLIGRIVETWGFFWDQVLPYVEGALLPLQTDPLLLSLYRAPKQRPSSPTRHNIKTSISSNAQLGITGSSVIDVRTVALQSFRDKVILPFAPRLAKLLKDNVQDASYQQPRLQQMLLVLYSQTRQRLPTFSLTAPAPEPMPGEVAVANLLRFVRSPNPSTQSYNRRRTTYAPTFLSHGTPRDRRGRIGDKDFHRNFEVEEDKTPTVRIMGDPEKGREREYLEALRSPDYEHQQTGVRASAGWGLGVDYSGKEEEDENEDPTDWDQAQAIVERMVGMQAQ